MSTGVARIPLATKPASLGTGSGALCCGVSTADDDDAADDDGRPADTHAGDRVLCETNSTDVLRFPSAASPSSGFAVIDVGSASSGAGIPCVGGAFGQSFVLGLHSHSTAIPSVFLWTTVSTLALSGGVDLVDICTARSAANVSGA